jgi:hypothetical protein
MLDEKFAETKRPSGAGGAMSSTFFKSECIHRDKKQRHGAPAEGGQGEAHIQGKVSGNRRFLELLESQQIKELMYISTHLISNISKVIL